ncbi:hypothetical protein SEA_RANDO14_64 [Mycobacterium phage Rando14]|uniref:Uncharacterized protein n=1 Tax=Mycobacterium phage Rando14 TaxID=2301556 RepID=A0A385D504_9CAUD|nr:hypothetical protein I5G75_gp32 [Mycobacterium phage Rando14]AXQ53084.1 hypothetical protein SEA_RANDO14_64 [Mycobacterium phage Rando14]
MSDPAATAADPAIESARRALVSTRGHGKSTICEIEAAREALKPIRKLHQKMSAEAPLEDVEVEHGMRAVLDALAPLIYSTEELQR